MAGLVDLRHVGVALRRLEHSLDQRRIAVFEQHQLRLHVGAFLRHVQRIGDDGVEAIGEHAIGVVGVKQAVHRVGDLRHVHAEQRQRGNRVGEVAVV